MAEFPPSDPQIEGRIRRIGGEILDRMEAARPRGFSGKDLQARLRAWSMRDPGFKARLFRFVDVLPALDSAAEVARHLREYLGEEAAELNPALRAGLAASGFAPGLVAAPVRAAVSAMAREFVAAEKPDEVRAVLRERAGRGLLATVDLLGEVVVSEAEADEYLRRNLALLELAADRLGPRLKLSVKISALAPALHPADPEGAVIRLMVRLRPLLRRAREAGAFVNFDMESHGLKALTLELFKAVLAEEEFRAGPGIGIALQAYLRETEGDLEALLAWAKERGRAFAVRLVKGAYWDYETILARQRGWPAPVWSEKAETDANFEKLTVRLFEHREVATAAIASHNVRSCAHALARAEAMGIDREGFEFQALFGMADELKEALVGMGHRVREYCPIGELLPGMAYLVRRLLENTSNESFLRAVAAKGASREELLADPAGKIGAGGRSPRRRGGKGGGGEAPFRFQNAPATDFTRAGERERMRAALREEKGRLGRRHPLLIGEWRIGEREEMPSVNPARPAEIVGYWARAKLEDAEAAVAAAREAFPAWRAVPAEERAEIADRAADLMERRRFELAALEILEAGKPWVEADADVCEAIDFCRFYAAEMRARARPEATQKTAGEDATQGWVPRGAGVAIAPWNFPLAILTGLSLAPLVAGNTVVVKPAEQTSILGARLVELLRQAGVPSGAVHFLPGFGEEIGGRLVAHPGIDFIAFTGSRAVGLKIWEAAGKTAPGQANLKKVVCEMGGKNALIIDADADLDEAIPAVLQSAFGYSGQKCSALSRLILLEGIHDRFLDRFLPACASLRVGDPAEPGTVVGPVIDAEARGRILAAIEGGKKRCRLAFEGSVGEAERSSGGYYVAPVVFTGVAPADPLAQEEIFGPVLAVLRASDLDHALRIANGTAYALTAGIFSRSPSALGRAARELEAGNIYLNRGITGAIVERHPFGGYKMSGAGTKAGGRGYIENFLFPRAVAENTLRRGFAPSEEG